VNSDRDEQVTYVRSPKLKPFDKSIAEELVVELGLQHKKSHGLTDGKPRPHTA
jgi:hypothetical protein